MGHNTEAEWKECTADFQSIMRKGEKHYSIYVGMENEEIAYQIINNHNGITVYAFDNDELKSYFQFIMQRRN